MTLVSINIFFALRCGVRSYLFAQRHAVASQLSSMLGQTEKGSSSNEVMTFSITEVAVTHPRQAWVELYRSSTVYNVSCSRDPRGQFVDQVLLNDRDYQLVLFALDLSQTDIMSQSQWNTLQYPVTTIHSAIASSETRILTAPEELHLWSVSLPQPHLTHYSSIPSLIATTKTAAATTTTTTAITTTTNSNSSSSSFAVPSPSTENPMRFLVLTQTHFTTPLPVNVEIRSRDQLVSTFTLRKYKFISLPRLLCPVKITSHFSPPESAKVESSESCLHDGRIEIRLSHKVPGGNTSVSLSLSPHQQSLAFPRLTDAPRKYWQVSNMKEMNDGNRDISFYRIPRKELEYQILIYLVYNSSSYNHGGFDSVTKNDDLKKQSLVPNVTLLTHKKNDSITTLSDTVSEDGLETADIRTKVRVNDYAVMGKITFRISTERRLSQITRKFNCQKVLIAFRKPRTNEPFIFFQQFLVKTNFN